ncbi:unnamed protein product [Durusdinium trenchii]|uniref:Uncharacterized protein n=1 Tax=Durusdinium trenchii TaxID=1381693 RepID=A0ABP0KXQ7_9DINO
MAKVVVLLVLLVWWLDLPKEEENPYQVLEFFSGVGRIAALSKLGGLRSAAVDIVNGEEVLDASTKDLFAAMEFDDEVELLRDESGLDDLAEANLDEMQAELESPDMMVNRIFVVYLDSDTLVAVQDPYGEIIAYEDAFVKTCRKKAQLISEDDLFVDGQFMSEQDMIDEGFKEPRIAGIKAECAQHAGSIRQQDEFTSLFKEARKWPFISQIKALERKQKKEEEGVRNTTPSRTQVKAPAVSLAQHADALQEELEDHEPLPLSTTGVLGSFSKAALHMPRLGVFPFIGGKASDSIYLLKDRIIRYARDFVQSYAWLAQYAYQRNLQLYGGQPAAVTLDLDPRS